MLKPLDLVVCKFLKRDIPVQFYNETVIGWFTKNIIKYFLESDGNSRELFMIFVTIRENPALIYIIVPTLLDFEEVI